MFIGVFCVYAVLVLLFKDFKQPVTILAAMPLALGGALVLISGVFLFFHFESFLVKFVHEVGGALLVVACVPI